MAEARFEVVLLGGHHYQLGMSRSTGMHRIATELRDHGGFTVHTIDYLTYLADILPDDERRALLARYLSADTLLVGLSTTLLSKDTGKDIFFWGPRVGKIQSLVNDIRSLAPDAKIVVGGAQVMECDLPMIGHYYGELADFWVCGQAERSVLALANHLKYNDVLRVREIEGVNAILETDYPYESFTTSRIEWTDQCLINPGETLVMEVARGCVFKCAFCAYSLIGKKWGDMTRSASVIRADLIRNYEQYGTTRYIITDDTINDSLEKVLFLHDIFTNLPFKIEWTCYARLDLIWKFPEMAELLYEAGMRGVAFGIETFDYEAGKRIGKGLGRERILDTLQKCRNVWGSDVQITGLFILGLPLESIDSMKATIEYLDSEDCLLDSCNVTALQISSERGLSRMDRSTDKFGYRRTDERQWTRFEDWETDITTAVEMRKLAGSFNFRPRQDHRRFQQYYSSFVSFACYSMMQPDEMASLSPDKCVEKLEVLQSNALKSYFEKAALWEAKAPMLPMTERISPVVMPKS